jgi:hypothetical protein
MRLHWFSVKTNVITLEVIRQPVLPVMVSEWAYLLPLHAFGWPVPALAGLVSGWAAWPREGVKHGVEVPPDAVPVVLAF